MPASTAPDPGEVPDIDLVKRCQAGDTRAFDVLVSRYRTRIYAMTYHMIQNETEAWDLAQEAFIKAWRAVPSFKMDSAFYTWLYRIAHNVVYDWLRKKKIQGDSEFDDSRREHRVAAGAEAVPHIKIEPVGAPVDLANAVVAMLVELSAELVVVDVAPATPVITVPVKTDCEILAV